MSFSKRLIAAALSVILPASQVLAATAPVVGRFAVVMGEVFVNGKAAKSGDKLRAKDEVATMDGKAILVVGGRNVFHLNPKTLVRVAEHSISTTGKEESGTIDLAYGAIRGLMSKERGVGKKFRIRTQSATMGVRGTELQAVRYDPVRGTEVKLVEGFSNIGSTTGTQSDNGAVSSDGNPVSPGNNSEQVADPTGQSYRSAYFTETAFGGITDQAFNGNDAGAATGATSSADGLGTTPGSTAEGTPQPGQTAVPTPTLTSTPASTPTPASTSSTKTSGKAPSAKSTVATKRQKLAAIALKKTKTSAISASKVTKASFVPAKLTPPNSTQGKTTFTIIEGQGEVTMNNPTPGATATPTPVTLGDGQTLTVKDPDPTDTPGRQTGTGVVTLDPKTLDQKRSEVGIVQDKVNTPGDADNVTDNKPKLETTLSNIPKFEPPKINFDPVANGGTSGNKRVKLRFVQ